MSVYKPFTTSDIVLSPFEVNKSFTFQGAAALTGSGVDRFIGKNSTPTDVISAETTTGQISSIPERLVYDSVKQLYYSNFISNRSSLATPFHTPIIPSGSQGSTFVIFWILIWSGFGGIQSIAI